VIHYSSKNKEWSPNEKEIPSKNPTQIFLHAKHIFSHSLFHPTCVKRSAMMSFSRPYLQFQLNFNFHNYAYISSVVTNFNPKNAALSAI
jgi:hypothetical protein